MVKKLTETIADAWGVPKDVMMNIPRITILGDLEIYIENYKSIVNYTRSMIKISTGGKNIVIEGENLEIAAVRVEDILIKGRFSGIKYEDNRRERRK